VQEGNVGGGTGMVAYRFKGGIGTASRVIDHDGRTFTVGVILQANHGYRRDLRIAGIPVGELITDLMPATPLEDEFARLGDSAVKNSLLILIATDCPLQPHQLNRLARRAALGVGRNGSTGADFSGELVVAFSTTNTYLLSERWKTIPLPTDTNHALLDALFEATVQAVEEALVNQLVASETMTGVNGNTVYALPHDRLIELLKKYNRYNPPDGVTDRQP
jgi:L-aminopeptidase/D-esterase-like protein